MNIIASHQLGNQWIIGWAGRSDGKRDFDDTGSFTTDPNQAQQWFDARAASCTADSMYIPIAIRISPR